MDSDQWVDILIKRPVFEVDKEIGLAIVKKSVLGCLARETEYGC